MNNVYANIILIFYYIFFVININAQKKKDINAIKSMCGCFEIEFNFSETFSANPETKSKNYKAKALEWAQLVSSDNNHISIQHLLIVGSERFPSVVKHWRQDWIYQNTDLYVYDVNNRWKFIKKNKSDVKNQWTQKVFQVDDSPRYEGTATWVHVDGKSYWENITPAPLPRREFSKRKDYNVTLRGNRNEITQNGWVHDQDNQKINIDESGKKEIIAYEKGFNTYTRVEDERCIAAKKWWNDNNEKWSVVRDKWSEVYSENEDLTLESTVQGKKLYEYLFSKKYSDKKSINSVIDKFLKS